MINRRSPSTGSARFFRCMLLMVLSGSMALVACRRSTVEDTVKQVYLENNSEIIGRQIHWEPKMFRAANPKFGKATDIDGAKVLMVVGAECSPCIDKFIQWNDFLAEKKLKPIDVVFIATGKNNGYFDLHVNQKNNFRFHILLDEDNLFVPANQLYVYQNMTFLLDRHNRVILVGDPTHDQTILDYYNEEIEKTN